MQENGSGKCLVSNAQLLKDCIMDMSSLPVILLVTDTYQYIYIMVETHAKLWKLDPKKFSPTQLPLLTLHAMLKRTTQSTSAIYRFEPNVGIGDQLCTSECDSFQWNVL